MASQDGAAPVDGGVAKPIWLIVPSALAAKYPSERAAVSTTIPHLLSSLVSSSLNHSSLIAVARASARASTSVAE